MSERPHFVVDSSGQAEDLHRKRIMNALEDARNAAGAVAMNRSGEQYQESLHAAFAAWPKDDLVLLMGRYRAQMNADEVGAAFQALGELGGMAEMDLGETYNIRRNLEQPE